MSTTLLPTAGLQWRVERLAPPDVTAGRWCPLDHTPLRTRRDDVACPTCKAAWDFQGEHGWWLPQDTVVRSWWHTPAVGAAVAVPTGTAAVVAGAHLRPAAEDVSMDVVWMLAALLAVPAVLAGVAAAALWFVDWARYRHNEVLGVRAAIGQAPAESAGQVSR